MDMYAIAKKWVDFVPKVHKERPILMAEMFAFCIAAAHENLPHQRIDSMMISDPYSNAEGWPLVDKIPIDGMCDFAKNPQHDVYAVPSLIHYCQKYTIDEWVFYKRKMVEDFFTCESPLMVLPPPDIIKGKDYKQQPTKEEKKDLMKRKRK